MLVDLVQTTTRDGYRLDGSFQGPLNAAGSKLGLDALCFVHGTGGNFYGSTLFDAFSERFVGLNCAVLRVNTRGHDGISTTSTVHGGGKRLGAAYEFVDDCRHDLAVWVEWLQQRCGPRIGLLGHSLGAVKALYALASEPGLDVAGLIAVSPPRLSYSHFCSSPQGPDFLDIYHRAQRHVEAGQPQTLLEVRLPLPFVITAAGYVEKYGPDERYNFLKYVAALRCPTLFTFGAIELESNMAFRGSPEALAGLTKRPDGLSVETVAGADHFYSKARQEVVACVEGWLKATFMGEK